MNISEALVRQIVEIFVQPMLAEPDVTRLAAIFSLFLL